MSYFGLGMQGGGIGGNDSFTKALLHFDGTNGSQVFTDVNAAGISNTWTPPSGAATLTTANVKFGSASFNCNSSYISTPTKTAFNPGSGPFTVDFWYNSNGGTGFQGLCFLGTNSTFASNYSWSMIRNNTGGVIQIQVSDGTNQPFGNGSTNLGAGWHHVAMVINGSQTKLYIDGNLDLTMSSVGSIQPSSGNLWIGRDVVGLPSTGFMDEFRYSVGIARWTSNFIPPTQPYS